jgi:NAD(P)-dependent dehydrogenase (short-subunit alcohol dehydrogenase family)
MAVSNHANVALVTGGGSGIGRAAAELFAQHGWQVMISGRREAPLAEVASKHTAIRYRVADITADGEADALVAHTVETYGRLDTLVNSAGVFDPVSVRNATAETIAGLFRTNVSAPAQLLRAAIPHLETSSGSVVNVTSAVAQRQLLQAFYGASKAALDYLTKSWAAELAELNIRVNAVAPGPTATTMATTAVNSDELAALKDFQLPLRRMGEPAEVARWICLLAEPAASWVTGQIIAVDGGMTIG